MHSTEGWARGGCASSSSYSDSGRQQPPRRKAPLPECAEPYGERIVTPEDLVADMGPELLAYHGIGLTHGDDGDDGCWRQQQQQPQWQQQEQPQEQQQQQHQWQQAQPLPQPPQQLALEQQYYPPYDSGCWDLPPLVAENTMPAGPGASCWWT